MSAGARSVNQVRRGPECAVRIARAGASASQTKQKSTHSHLMRLLTIEAAPSGGAQTTGRGRWGPERQEGRTSSCRTKHQGQGEPSEPSETQRIHDACVLACRGRRSTARRRGTTAVQTGWPAALPSACAAAYSRAKPGRLARLSRRVT